MSALPLDDLRVLEFTHHVAGPFAGLILADLGAEVIKIERPDTGEFNRVSGTTGKILFNTFNRNKKSVELDLKTSDGRNAVKTLCRDADFLLENFGPGTFEDIGLDYETLKGINPGLIYISIKGFNQGPYSDRRATDPIIEAMTGLMKTTGYEGNRPTRTGTSTADYAASLNAVIGALAALWQRETTGRGQKIEVGMFESTTNFMNYWIAWDQLLERKPPRLGASHPSAPAPSDIFPTKDEEWIFITVPQDSQFESLKDVLGFAFEPASQKDRIERKEEIHGLVREATATRTRDELLDALLDNGIPASPVNDVQDVRNDTHLRKTGAFSEIHPTGIGEDREILLPHTPILSSEYRIDGTGKDPPRLGEHNTAVLREIGLSAEEIEKVSNK